MSTTTPAAPQKFHLDRRADKIAASIEAGDDDALLTTRQLADWFDVSTQWVEQGRIRKYGPPFVRIAARSVRYRRGDVLKWLKARRFRDTSEYAR